MRKDIVTLIREISRQGMTPSISTNSTRLTEQLAVDLYDAGVRYVPLSIDGATKASHDSLRNTPGSFDRTMNGIGYLMRNHIEAGASCRVTWENIEGIPQVIRLGQEKKLSVLSFYLIAPIGRSTHTAYQRELVLMEKVETLLQTYGNLDAPRIEVFRTTTGEKNHSAEHGLTECKGQYFYTITNSVELCACPW